MQNEDLPTLALQGFYRDVVHDAAGRVVSDSGWQKNTITRDCRRLIAALLKGETNTAGIQGLWVGQGSSTWGTGVPPSPAPTDTLADQNPWLSQVQMDYLDATASSTSTTPTNVLRMIATLGANQPPWPDANHNDGTLREFGLVGKLDGQQVLINLVRHVAIVKDPANTLVRTIQLVF